MQNRRRESRLDCNHRLPVFNQLRRRRIGELGNVSEGGFQLISDSRLPMEQDLLYWVKLPNGMGQRTWTALQARVIWRHRDAASGLFHHGLCIADSARQPLLRILGSLRQHNRSDTSNT